MIVIENQNLRIEINRIGAELSSIRSKTKDTEYLWQGDPKWWAGRAPVLFPVIGALKDDTCYFDNKAWSLPRHGFARNNPAFELSGQTPSTAELRLTDSPATRAMYPFAFELTLTFRLNDNTLTIDHQVLNTGQSTMFFSLGGHPAFRCPLFDDETFDDYFLRFERPETDVTWKISPHGLIETESRPLLHQQDTLALSPQLFEQGALIFKDLKSKQIEFVSRKRGRHFSFSFPDFPYLGIWTKPGAPFVCLEPWQGIADCTTTTQNLTEKEGVVALEAGCKWQGAYSIDFEQ